MKKLDLSRFKKTVSGLTEFATLLEQAAPLRRKKIIEEVQQVDRFFIRKALKKVVYFEELEYLDEGILSEILSNVSTTVLAYSLHGMPEGFRKHILKHLSYRETVEIREADAKILANVSMAFVEGARSQVLKIARDLEKKNRFVFELLDCPRFKEELSRKTGTKK